MDILFCVPPVNHIYRDNTSESAICISLYCLESAPDVLVVRLNEGTLSDWNYVRAYELIKLYASCTCLVYRHSPDIILSWEGVCFACDVPYNLVDGKYYPVDPRRLAIPNVCAQLLCWASSAYSTYMRKDILFSREPDGLRNSPNTWDVYLNLDYCCAEAFRESIEHANRA